MRGNLAAFLLALCGLAPQAFAAPQQPLKILPPKVSDSAKLNVPLPPEAVTALRTTIAKCAADQRVIETNMSVVRQHVQGYRDSQARLAECRRTMERAETTRKDTIPQIDARLAAIEQANRAPAGSLRALRVAWFAAPAGQRGMVLVEQASDPPVVRAAKRDQALGDLLERYGSAENEAGLAYGCVQAEPRNGEQQLELYGSALDRCRQGLAQLQDEQRQLTKADQRLQLGLTPTERDDLARCSAAKPQCLNKDGVPAPAWAPGNAR